MTAHTPTPWLCSHHTSSASVESQTCPDCAAIQTQVLRAESLVAERDALRSVVTRFLADIEDGRIKTAILVRPLVNEARALLGAK